MSHKYVSIFTLALLTFVAGCASPQAAWRKDGVSPDGITSALSECKYQVGLNKVPEGERKELITNCMQSKGFRWRYD